MSEEAIVNEEFFEEKDCEYHPAELCCVQIKEEVLHQEEDSLDEDTDAQNLPKSPKLGFEDEAAVTPIWCDCEIGRRLRLEVSARSRDKKKNRCTVCGFKTRQKGTLANHLIAHFARDILNCSKCDYKTFYSWNLEAHAKVHEAGRVCEKLECALCDFRTYRRNRLKRHVKSHLERRS